MSVEADVGQGEIEEIRAGSSFPSLFKAERQVTIASVVKCARNEEYSKDKD